jgi:hypothetical protein
VCALLIRYGLPKKYRDAIVAEVTSGFTEEKRKGVKGVARGLLAIQDMSPLIWSAQHSLAVKGLCCLFVLFSD